MRLLNMQPDVMHHCQNSFVSLLSNRWSLCSAVSPSFRLCRGEKNDVFTMLPLHLKFYSHDTYSHHIREKCKCLYTLKLCQDKSEEANWHSIDTVCRVRKWIQNALQKWRTPAFIEIMKNKFSDDELIDAPYRALNLCCYHMLDWRDKLTV